MNPQTPDPRPRSPLARPAVPGIDQIRVTSGSGLTVNVFVVAGPDGPAMLDAGFTTTTDQLVDGLRELDLEPEHIGRIVYTHTHEDHMGGGVALESRWVGEHVLWAGTSALIGANWYDYYDRFEAWDSWLDELLPEGPERDAILGLRAKRKRSILRTTGSGRLDRVLPVEIGDVVRAGSLELECLDARGHDPCHVAWVDRRRRVAFTGDVLLRGPTPIMPPLHDDLPTYRATLRRWSESLDVDLVLPGHGRPVEDPLAAIAGSMAFMRDVWDACAQALSGRDAVNPAHIAAALHGQGDPRAAYIALANVHSQLLEFADRGLASVLPDRRWVRLQTIPDFEGN